MIISIEGNIGSGKTTLLKMLKNKFNVVFEPNETWDEWLNSFYINPKKYSFGFQLKVLLTYKNAFNNKENVIYERNPSTIFSIFTKKLYELNNLESIEYKLCEEYYSMLSWKPDYIIYLECDPSHCYDRIKKRERKGEEIDYEYLISLHNQYNIYFNELIEIPFIKIDSNRSKENIFNDLITIINNLFS